MIESPALFAATILLLAGLFPAIAARWPIRVFDVAPPIVLSYAVTTALAVAGLWKASPDIGHVQSMALEHLTPALVFTLVARCDLRAIAGLGPRVMIAFATATLSVMAGMLVAWTVWRPWLSPDGWKACAAVAAGWVGGTANLVAVSRAIDTSPELVSQALITDTICYTCWVLVLFGTVPLAGRFNAWMRASPLEVRTAATSPDPGAPMTPGVALVWLGLGLAAGVAATAIARHLPSDGVISTKAWTLLVVTGMAAVAALTPLRKLAGAAAVSDSLLAVVVVTMASQGSLNGLARAPVFILAGLTTLLVHALAMLGAARAFRLDLASCAIASLANIGGVGSAPLVAAAHAPRLAPIGVVLGLLGYFVGSAAGLVIADILPRIGLGGSP